MSEATTGWFHCGRCGALFQSETGTEEPAPCTECGRSPVVMENEIAFHRAALGEAAGTRRRSKGDSRHGHHRHRRPSRTKRFGLMSLALAWCLVLLVIAGVALFNRDPEAGDRSADEGNEFLGNRDHALVAEQLPGCRDRLERFLSTAAPEARINEVLSSASLGRLTRFYVENSMLVIPEPELETGSWAVLRTPVGRAIEGVWKNSDGRLVEAVFFQEGDEPDDWRIDWDAFVRYSETEWRRFLDGEGGEVAEFRVLARMRARDVGLEGTVEKLVLYAPVVGRPGEAGLASPEIRVDPESRTGRILVTAFEERARGNGAYGSKLSDLDPKHMIRVRVRIKRIDGDEPHFEIQKVIACHWLHLDDLGLGE